MIDTSLLHDLEAIISDLTEDIALDEGHAKEELLKADVTRLNDLLKIAGIRNEVTA